MKLSFKTMIPVFLALIFLGSIFAVFSHSSGSSKLGNAELIVNFGLPTMIEGKEITVTQNLSALRFLSSYAVHVEVDSGDVKCISNYCNTDTSAWIFYVNNVLSDENAENYIVKRGDQILFRYEQLPEPEVVLGASSINETAAGLNNFSG